MNKGVQESIKTEKSTNRHSSSGKDEIARSAASSASGPLSVLILPSLKEAVADDLEASVVRSVIHSLMDMEFTKPGSCEFLVTRILHRLASSKEASLKDLQEVARKVIEPESVNANAEADNKKKQPNGNLSLLAQFLLSRWQVQALRDLNSI